MAQESNNNQSIPRRIREAVQAQKPEFEFDAAGGGSESTVEQSMGGVLMRWTPLEYQFESKEENWYLAGGVIAAIFISGAILFRNYLMAVTFFLLAVVIYIYSERKPHKIPVELREFGIRVGAKFYSFRDLSRFWIIYRPGDLKTLTIETNNLFNPTVSIQIEDQDPNKIRDILKDRLYEDLDHQESSVDRIARNLKL